MSETGLARVSGRIESAAADLPPATRPVVRDAVARAPDGPVALVAAVGRASGEPSRTDLETLATAVGALAGYVRIRLDLTADRYERGRERDRALLASDYLHARAHETIGDTSLPPARQLACYRRLTAGSRSIATRVFADGDGDVTSPTPRAILAGTAGALGAAAAVATDDVVEAASTYGESLATATALASHAAAASESPGPLVRALDGEGIADADADADADGIDRHLERARAALDAFPASPARARLERATRVRRSEPDR